MKRKRRPKIRGLAFCPVHDYDRWRCDAECVRQRLDASRAADALYQHFYRVKRRAV